MKLHTMFQDQFECRAVCRQGENVPGQARWASQRQVAGKMYDDMIAILLDLVFVPRCRIDNDPSIVGVGRGSDSR
jgi:hypothetical protein